MSFPVLIAALAQEFKWPHDFWRRMGWREFHTWVRSLSALRDAEAEAVARQQQEAEREAKAAEALERLRRGHTPGGAF